MALELKLEPEGRVRVWEDGPRVFFRCERSLCTDGIYKVWIRGGGGGEFLLGTLAPEGERLTLSRVVALFELERCGCRPPRGAYCRMTSSFAPRRQEALWRRTEDPRALVDGETGEMGDWCPMLVRREEGGVCLAVPLCHDRPLPLTGLICLARAGTVEGRACLLWRFDGSGRPLPPQDMGE